VVDSGSLHQTARGPISSFESRKRGANMLGTILIVVLILALIGALPRWPHSRNWGYGPSGGVGLVVLILIVLLLPTGVAGGLGRALSPLTSRLYTRSQSQ